MPAQTVTKRVPTYTAFRYNGTQADIDALNTYLTGSDWQVTASDATSYRITGPHGAKTFNTIEVIVFVKPPAGGPAVAVAKYPNLSAMGDVWQ